MPRHRLKLGQNWCAVHAIHNKRDQIERYLGPDRHICKLFAHSQRAGWDCWGNETDRFGAAA